QFLIPISRSNSRRRPQRVDRGPVDGESLPTLGRYHLGAGVGGHTPGLVRVRSIDRDAHPVDAPAPGRARISGEVIGIEVGDEQVELLDPGVIETGVDRLRLLAGVDDQSPALAGVDHRARTLTDVADE